MVDEMVGFFCLAAVVFLLRYLDRPDFQNAIGCGLCCACATLTKYSGAYVCVLPLAACICLRRYNQLRKPNFVVQYQVMAIVIAPSPHRTMNLQTVGLPRMPPPLTRRIGRYLTELFRIFPPVLAAVVILGLLILMVMPRVWRPDLGVIALLSVGCLAFVMLAPVAPEARYLLVPCAGLLALSFAGWAAALEPWSKRGPAGAWGVPALAAIVTLCMAAAYLRTYEPAAGVRHSTRCPGYRRRSRMVRQENYRGSRPGRANDCRIRRAGPPSSWLPVITPQQAICGARLVWRRICVAFPFVRGNDGLSSPEPG